MYYIFNNMPYGGQLSDPASSKQYGYAFKASCRKDNGRDWT